MFDFSRLMQFMHCVVSAAAFHIHTLVDHVCGSGENLFLSSHTLQTEHAAGFSLLVSSRVALKIQKY